MYLRLYNVEHRMIVAESGELFLDLIRCTDYYHENAVRIAGLWVETGTLDLRM